jgi:hypothetical protein
MFDIVSGYKHKPLPADWKSWPIEKLRAEGYVLDDKAWLRVSFNSIAVTHSQRANRYHHIMSILSYSEDSFP